MSDNISDTQFFNKLRKKQLEVSSVPEQNLGAITSYYKRGAAYLKVAPWRIIIPASIAGVLAFRVVSGLPLTHIVSILQEGF